LIKAIIFDFDGVIAESVNIKTDAFKKMYAKYGNTVVKKVISHHLLNGGISRYEKFNFYHENFLGIKLSEEELEKLAIEFSELVVQDVVEAPYVHGALEFIENNYKDYKYFISTGTPQNEIIDIINRKKISIYFESIYGSPENKTDHIKKIMSKSGYTKDELIFIGDADTDILAAKNNDIPIILRVHPDSNCKYEYNKLIKINNLNNIIGVLLSIQN